MTTPSGPLKHLIDQAQQGGPIRVAVVDAAQGLVIDTLREAHALGIIEPRLIGAPEAIASACRDLGWKTDDDWIIPTSSDQAAAVKATQLVQAGDADAIMKGNIHTDVLMRALLDNERGLRLAGRRVSHVFLAEVPSRRKFLGITDAAINIAPDLSAKAQILRNAIELFHLIGIETPKAAVLSAVETVNPDIVSTLKVIEE